MADVAAVAVPEPFPIFSIANRYLLYDVNTVTYIRRQHNICGVFVGSIPHVPQQNVFLGLPLELLPEEARLLVERGNAYIVDDVDAHRAGLMAMSPQERKALLSVLEKQGRQAARASQKSAQERKERALGSLRQRHEGSGSTDAGDVEATDDLISRGEEPDESSLFDSPVRTDSSSPSQSRSRNEELLHVTPTTSFPLLPPPLPPKKRLLPVVPKSYPLFAFLHDKGYFLSPGLRFGCQYLVYPGDPLRFHSHFLANGIEWDEEFRLLDLVGGGRLGTGVKKGFMIGGKEEPTHNDEHSEQVRAFSIEWAGM